MDEVHVPVDNSPKTSEKFSRKLSEQSRLTAGMAAKPLTRPEAEDAFTATSSVDPVQLLPVVEEQGHNGGDHMINLPPDVKRKIADLNRRL